MRRGGQEARSGDNNKPLSLRVYGRMNAPGNLILVVKVWGLSRRLRLHNVAYQQALGESSRWGRDKGDSCLRCRNDGSVRVN